MSSKTKITYAPKIISIGRQLSIPKPLESEPSKKWPFLRVREDDVFFFKLGDSIIELEFGDIGDIGEVRLVAYGSHPPKSFSFSTIRGPGQFLGKAKVEDIPRLKAILATSFEKENTENQ